jgi:hypothetical protein
VLKPDLTDSFVLCQLFEERNKHLGLFYTRDVLETFLEIFDDLQHVLGQQENCPVPDEWDTRVEQLSSLIKEIKNQYTFQMINDRFVKTLYQAKKTPIDRALSFKVLNSAIN